MRVIGHSLGGAIAHFAAIELANQGYEVDLITFGSPRVGDGDFGKIVQNSTKTVYRVTHNRDPVVHVPIELQGFVHAGVEVWYKNKHIYTVCNVTAATSPIEVIA